uniref:Uncharacterized protein n=1 Tax=Solanum tuberosum TaxID=4113 RepID=M1DR24_SOLTU
MRVPTAPADPTNKTEREHEQGLNRYPNPSFAAFRNYHKHLYVAVRLEMSKEEENKICKVLLSAFLAAFPCISVFSHYVLELLIAANSKISTWNREDAVRYLLLSFWEAAIHAGFSFENTKVDGSGRGRVGSGQGEVGVG